MGALWGHIKGIMRVHRGMMGVHRVFILRLRGLEFACLKV